MFIFTRAKVKLQDAIIRLLNERLTAIDIRLMDAEADIRKLQNKRRSRF